MDFRRSAGRAAHRLREYALANRLPLFATFTLDGARLDRYDVPTIVRKFNQWADNRVRRNGLRYIIVPERHKDGAVHFHGLLNDVLPRTPSGTWKNPETGRPVKARSARQADAWRAEGRQEVFNLPGWPFGFSTALVIQGDYHQTVNYVSKYITKQQAGCGKVAGRWYYHSSNLAEPVRRVGHVDCRALMEAGGRVRNVPEAGMTLVYLTIKEEDFCGISW